MLDLHIPRSDTLLIFKNFHHVQRLSDEVSRHYNDDMPHEALGNLTPRKVTQLLGIENSN